MEMVNNDIRIGQLYVAKHGAELVHDVQPSAQR